MNAQPYIIDATLENFAQILERSQEVPVLVDFWAEWCGPCRSLLPVVTRLAEEYQGKFLLAKVNIDQQQELAMQFGVRSVPTVKLFRNGAQVDEFMGAQPESVLRAFLEPHLARPADESGCLAERLGQRLRITLVLRRDTLVRMRGTAFHAITGKFEVHRSLGAPRGIQTAVDFAKRRERILQRGGGNSDLLEHFALSGKCADAMVEERIPAALGHPGCATDDDHG